MEERREPAKVPAMDQGPDRLSAGHRHDHGSHGHAHLPAGAGAERRILWAGALTGGFLLGLPLALLSYFISFHFFNTIKQKRQQKHLLH